MKLTTLTIIPYDYKSIKQIVDQFKVRSTDLIYLQKQKISKNVCKGHKGDRICSKMSQIIT
jgi:hypothetical protein